MERIQVTVGTSAIDTQAQDVIAASLARPGSEVVPLPSRESMELRKGRLVIRVPTALELSPYCVCTCRECVGGCLPCLMTA